MARRPWAQIAAVGRLEKQLGSLPVIADFLHRLDIAGIVDRARTRARRIRRQSLARHASEQNS